MLPHYMQPYFIHWCIVCICRSDGVVVPLGTSKDTGITNPGGYTLNYNGMLIEDNIRSVKVIHVTVILLVKFSSIAKLMLLAVVFF